MALPLRVAGRVLETIVAGWGWLDEARPLVDVMHLVPNPEPIGSCEIGSTTVTHHGGWLPPIPEYPKNDIEKYRK